MGKELLTASQTVRMLLSKSALLLEILQDLNEKKLEDPFNKKILASYRGILEYEQEISEEARSLRCSLKRKFKVAIADAYLEKNYQITAFPETWKKPGVVKECDAPNLMEAFADCIISVATTENKTSCVVIDPTIIESLQKGFFTNLHEKFSGLNLSFGLESKVQDQKINQVLMVKIRA